MASSHDADTVRIIRIPGTQLYRSLLIPRFRVKLKECGGAVRFRCCHYTCISACAHFVVRLGLTVTKHKGANSLATGHFSPLPYHHLELFSPSRHMFVTDLIGGYLPRRQHGRVRGWEQQLSLYTPCDPVQSRRKVHISKGG